MKNGQVVVGLYLGMGQVAGANFYKNFNESMADAVPKEHERPLILAREDSDLPRKDKGADGTGKSPLEGLKSGVDWFQVHQCDIIAIPCNTAMNWYEELSTRRSWTAMVTRQDQPHMMNIVEEVAKDIAEKYPRVRKIGLMSTRATHDRGLYHAAVRKYLPSAEIISLDESHQAKIAGAIEEVKMNNHSKTDVASNHIKDTASYLQRQGAEIAILGCTELPCAIDASKYEGIPLIDSSKALAEATVKKVTELQRNLTQSLKKSGQYNSMCAIL